MESHFVCEIPHCGVVRNDVRDDSLLTARFEKASDDRAS
jgi:hypothetical protein